MISGLETEVGSQGVMGAVLKGCSLVIEVDWLELEIEVNMA